MTKRSSGLPGEYVKKFTVTDTKLKLKEQTTVDGIHNPDGLFDSGGNVFYQDVSYMGTMRRLDGRFTLQLEWVDIDQGGHRVELPHVLVERIIQVHDRIMDEAKSDRAKRAMETRISRGYIPNFSKEKGEYRSIGNEAQAWREPEREANDGR